MDGDDLICNFKKCRKRLTTMAYVTACSHVFCDEDGTREFNKSQTCPACETTLTAKFEIVRNNLQPCEQYKSMILAGLKPDVINEIASRAQTFWAYQTHQEKTYQEYMATKAKERLGQLEQYYEQIVAKTTSEISNKCSMSATYSVVCFNDKNLKSQLAATRKDLDGAKKKSNELSDKLLEKSRQNQKLQNMYESLRRKFVTKSSFEGMGDASLKPSNSYNQFRLGNVSDEENLHVFPDTADMSDHPANSIQRKYSVNLGTPRQ